MTRGKALDDGTRRLIVELAMNHHKSAADISRQLRIPYNTVITIINVFFKHGCLAVSPRGGDKVTKLSDTHTDWLEAKLNEFPTLTVAQLHAQLSTEFPEVRVSTTTVSRALSHIGFTLKSVRPSVEGRNTPATIEKRREFVTRIHQQGIRFHEAVFIDETGYNLHVHRRFGRS